MAWTPIKTWRSGEMANAAELNLYLRDNLLELALPQLCAHVFYAADQNGILDNTWTVLNWTSEDHDVGGFHDNAVNPDRLTIPEAGVYVAGAHMLPTASNTTGSRQCEITLNNTGVPSSALLAEGSVFASQDGFGRFVALLGPRRLAAGDVLRTAFLQNSGSTMNLAGTSTFGPISNAFWVYRVGL